jgi:hypothetical protein
VAGRTFHPVTGLSRHDFDVVGTATAGQQKGFFSFAHDPDSAEARSTSACRASPADFFYHFRASSLNTRRFSTKNLLAFLLRQGHNLEPA